MLKAWLRRVLLEDGFDPERPPIEQLSIGVPLLKVYRIENGFLIEHGYTTTTMGVRYIFCKDVTDLQKQIVSTFARTRLDLPTEQLGLFADGKNPYVR